MGKRQKEWARKKRVELTVELGGKCAYCGSKWNLEFDCKTPVPPPLEGVRHGKLDTSHKMSFYRQQHALGNIQLLCETCNRVKGRKKHSDICPY